MADGKRRSKDRLDTPIPTTDLVALTQTLVRVDAGIKTIRDDTLPPIAKDVKEAREGVIELRTRVTALETQPPHEHDCEEKDRQARQDTDIAEMRPRVDTNGKIMWWVIGLLIVVGGGAFTFAVASRSEATANTTRIGDQAGDITRHEAEINALEKAQQRDRETYLREIRSLPQKVKTAAEREDPTIEDVEDITDDLPLTGREREQLLKILGTARKRANDPNNGLHL